MATPLGNSVALTGSTLIDGLLEGSKWSFSGSASVITYSLNHTSYETPRFSWTAAGASAVAKAFDAWSAVANVQFSKISSGYFVTQSNADITIAPAGDALAFIEAAGYAVFPDPVTGSTFIRSIGYARTDYPNPEGDIFYNETDPEFQYTNFGSRGFLVALHEIGHALGLKHPHDDGGNGRPTFASLGIASYDSGYSTVMSYNDTSSSLAHGHQATPMPLDILAIQYIYGANMSYHTGNDTYVLSDNRVIKTIWDAGGNDTISASSLGSEVTISLVVGSLINYGALGSATAIAFNVVIENVVGSAYSDSLMGNAADNILNGGTGDDMLTGWAGADRFAFNTKLGAANIDTISDFVSGTDAINLSKKLFGKYKAGADLTNDFVPEAGAIAHDKTDHFLYDTNTGYLYYDPDGSNSKAAVQFATLIGAPDLVASDLHIF